MFVDAVSKTYPNHSRYTIQISIMNTENTKKKLSTNYFIENFEFPFSDNCSLRAIICEFTIFLQIILGI